MKKSNFSIPKNIPHASGIFLAKKLLRMVTWIAFGMFAIWAVFAPQNDVLSWQLMCVAVVLFVFAPSYGYCFGRKDSKEIRSYLKSLKKKGSKEVALLEFKMNKIDQEVDQKILAIRLKIKDFFMPTIQSYLLIDTLAAEKPWNDFKKVQNQFAKKRLFLNDPFLSKLAVGLEGTLNDVVYNAIHGKEQINFDPEQWIESVDLRADRRMIYKRISKKLASQVVNLGDTLLEIEQMIAGYSQKKVL